jgi:dipeptidyl aminopeptidase/acylaminoacyl peptidase
MRFTLALLVSATAVFAQRPMTLVEFMNIPTLNNPQLSPDGKEIVFTRSEPNWKANRRISHLWRVNSDGTGLMQLTSGADTEDNARWSPDGKTIAFITKRGDAEAVNQIFLLSLAGGEARQLTNHGAAVLSPIWSPDGSTIYFRAANAKTEQQKAKERLRDDVFMYDENFEQIHLWSINVATKAEKRITNGDFSILNYKISKDGRQIAYHRAPSPLLGDSDQSEVWVADASGANAKQLTNNHVGENNAAISPDGTKVLFTSQANQKYDIYYNAKVFVQPISSGNSRVLTADLPYEVESASWSDDGRWIHFLANMGVHAELFEMPSDGGKPRQMTDGKHAITAWSENPKGNVYVSQDMAEVSEIWFQPTGGAAHKVTSIHANLAKEFKMPRQEKFEWKGKDGVTVEGLLYLPSDYREGTRYPLVVQTHGGPQASDKYGLGGGQNYIPVLTGLGFIVLQPNYRGSTGYGDDFLRDMVGHYFQNAHLDVMTGVDALIAKGIADPDHMIKMGWSGGGHMTNKIITFTDRFKAASAGAGAADWISMYAQSDTRTFRTPWFGGTPWQKDAPISTYWDNSPLKDVYKVKTPTIFLVGQNDPRVPEPQSIEMYRALKSLGVPTHLYVAPREPHGWEELRHVLFKMNAELAWFEEQAMKRDYKWETAPAQ